MNAAGMQMHEFCKVTVLRRPAGWPRQVISLLIERLKTMVYGHPMNPSALILMGDFNKETVERVVGTSDFYIEKVEGLDNPSLPFKPGAGL